MGLIIRRSVLTARKFEINTEKLRMQYARSREIRKLRKACREFDEPVKEVRTRYNEANNKLTEMLTLSNRYKSAILADQKARKEANPTEDVPPETEDEKYAQIIADFNAGNLKLGDTTINDVDDIKTAMETEKRKVDDIKRELDEACEFRDNQKEAYAQLITDTEEEFELMQQELEQDGEFVKAELDNLKQSIEPMLKELAPKYA